MNRDENDDVTRREFLEATALTSSLLVAAPIVLAAQSQASPALAACTITFNDVEHRLSIDPRVTLLDLLREQLHLTGTKKGCDHGQCGACTVIANGERINSCLALAVAHDGDHVTTIEGLSQGDQLHPMQESFLTHDGFQCGFCTPGQICSAVAMLREARSGALSLLSFERQTLSRATDFSDDDIRERMAGNICRCGAYPNIVAAIHDAAIGGHA